MVAGPGARRGRSWVATALVVVMGCLDEDAGGNRTVWQPGDPIDDSGCVTRGCGAPPPRAPGKWPGPCEVTGDGLRLRYGYDDQGWLVSREQYQDIESERGVLVMSMTRKNDEIGREIEESLDFRTDDPNGFDEIRSWRWDERGFDDRQTVRFVPDQNAGSHVRPVEVVYETEYDANDGTLTTRPREQDDDRYINFRRRVCWINSEKLISACEWDDDGDGRADFRSEYTYDDAGREVRAESDRDANRIVDIESRMTYDEAGNQLTETRKDLVDGTEVVFRASYDCFTDDR